jgi:hypothetical protein
VHGHGGDLSLLRRVAAIAVFGARNEGHSAVERHRLEAAVHGRVPGPGERERVAASTVRLGVGPEVRAGLRGRVLEVAFLGVAGGAARWRHRTDRGFGELVAAHAGDLLLDDVLVVPRHATRGLPSRIDVDAESWRAAWWIGRGARQDGGDRDGENERKRRRLDTKPSPHARSHRQRPGLVLVSITELLIEDVREPA